MDQRGAFLADQWRGLLTMRERCAGYGISRKTGDKRVARVVQDGCRGLAGCPLTSVTHVPGLPCCR